jgi:hypothetical protein
MRRRASLVLASVLVVLASMPAAVRAAAPSPPGEDPPPGCVNCGNYIRYGYITSDLAGWQTVRGQWQVTNTVSAPALHGNVLRATLFGFDGWAVLEQSVILPQAILGPGAAGSPRRWWVEVSYRSRGASAVPAARPLQIRLTGQGGVVVDETVQVVDGVWRRATFSGSMVDVVPANHRIALSVAVRNLDVEIDDLRFWVEDTIDVQGLCQPIPLTPVGEAVAERLAVLDGEGNAPYSALTACNDLPGDSNPTGDAWLLSNPDLRFPPTTTDSELYYLGLADDLRLTTSTFDLSSLGFDISSSAVEAEVDMVRTYLAPALADLNARFAGVPARHRPAVRLMLAGKLMPGPAASDVYETLVSEIAGPLNLRVAVREIGIIPDLLLSWNHTKIAVRDRQWATTGGQNWETKYLILDQDGKPLHDLNVRLQGDAAVEAAKYLDLLWARPRFGLCFGSSALCDHDDPPEINPLPVGDYGPANVFTFGRGLLDPLLVAYERSADELIYAALGAAQELVFISQDLTSPVPGYADALAKALFGGAEVRVTVSPRSVPAPTDQARWLFEALVARGPEQGVSEDTARELVCQRLRFAVMASEPGTVQPTHNKTFMVDDQALYVGSQNLYPSGIGDLLPSLDEFGFFISGGNYASVARDQYWDPLWQLAEAHEIPPPDLMCEPRLVAAPDPVTLVAAPGDSVSTTVTLTNVGLSTLDYAMASDVPWMAATGAGELEPGASAQVTLTATCPPSPVARNGTYHATVPPDDDVTFEVRNVCADYQIQPRTVVAHAPVGATASGGFAIRNFAFSPLGYAAQAPPGLSLSPAAAQIASLGFEVVTVSAACPSVPGVQDFTVPLLMTTGGETLEDEITVRRICTDPGSGGSTGEPHMVTYDRLRYDFQAGGQFVLTRGAFASSPPFEVQVRQAGDGRVAINKAVAARVGTHRVVWDGIDVRLDGLAVYPEEGQPIALDGGGELGRQGQALYALWPDGVSYVRVRPFSWGALGAGLDVAVKPGPGVSGLVGLLGDRDGDSTNDFALRDGTVLPPPVSFETLYGQFAYGDPLGWVIRQAAESLFFPDDGVDPASLIDEDVPDAPFGVDELPPEVRDWAEAVCLAAGVIEPGALEACILDVGVTGDPTVAASALETQQNGGSGPGELCDGLDNDGDGAIDEDNVCFCTSVVLEGSTYHFCATSVTWDEARDACVARGAPLVKIEDAAENGGIHDWMVVSNWDSDVWIGLRDVGETVMEWEWTDGTPMSYHNWGLGQPSSSEEDCVEHVAANGSWNDLVCEASRSFVCEE